MSYNRRSGARTVAGRAESASFSQVQRALILWGKAAVWPCTRWAEAAASAAAARQAGCLGRLGQTVGDSAAVARLGTMGGRCAALYFLVFCSCRGSGEYGR